MPTHDSLQGPVGTLQVAEVLGKRPITAIICHPHPLFGGTMDNKVVTTLARTMESLDVSSLRFNYRGVGDSAGSYGDIEGEVADALAVLNWVRARRPQETLWLMGFSFGAYIAARLANEKQVEKLISVAPAVQHAHFDSLPAISCPWLIIQGESDEIVPPDLVYAFAEKRPEHPTLVKMPETSHFFHGKLTDLKRIVVDYLSLTGA